MTVEARARLDYYQGGFGFVPHAVTVETEDGPVAAQAYGPEPGRWQAGAVWDFGAIPGPTGPNVHIWALWRTYNEHIK